MGLAHKSPPSLPTASESVHTGCPKQQERVMSAWNCHVLTQNVLDILAVLQAKTSNPIVSLIVGWPGIPPWVHSPGRTCTPLNSSSAVFCRAPKNESPKMLLLRPKARQQTKRNLTLICYVSFYHLEMLHLPIIPKRYVSSVHCTCCLLPVPVSLSHARCGRSCLEKNCNRVFSLHHRRVLHLRHSGPKTRAAFPKEPRTRL